MTQAWIYLIVAGLLEIGWPLGLKISQSADKVWQGTLLAIVSMALSGTFLWMAQRHIPMGTAYAVWTGIGAAGTFVLGIMLFNDSASMMRVLGASLIVGGVIVLKMAS